MASPTLPSFNLLFDFWIVAHTPPVGVPDHANLPGQLYVHSRADIDIFNTIGNPSTYTPPVFIRLPTAAALLVTATPAVAGAFRTITTGGRSLFYVVNWWEWMHLGFGNQYAAFLVKQCNNAMTTPDPSR